MKKQFEIATIMVAIMVLSVLTAMPVMSGNENITNMNKTNGDSSAKYIFDERGQIISSTIANETNISEVEHPVSIAASSDFAATSNLVGKIAFKSDRDGDWEIYVMDADGSNVTQLTRNIVNDWSPVWSPDGKRLAFASDRDGDLEIYVMNSDGSNVLKLTDNAIVDLGPSWSPNGKKIAFRSGESVTSTGIYVMNADGSNLKCLALPHAFISNQAWSPDGSKIVFSLVKAGGGEINVMNSTDGSNKRRLIQPAYSRGHKMHDDAPAWSPVGDKMVFYSFRHGFIETTPGTYEANGEIYVMDPDGSNLVRLTYDPYYTDYVPSWSPDGKRIVFVSECDGDREIYVMDADGSNVTPLTINTAKDSDPHWYSLKVWDPWIYDTNGNGVIEKNEAGNAAKDYFDGKITMEQALEVLLLHFATQP
uniref:Tol-Pal system protein TolB n=2 Tax=Methanomicrobia TaxID=224756 RepID=A0A7G9YD11_9EURY|nr:Tol-Pal system protein TolB [Methanosarcinales archaeon ANME-2c ERB4]QNO53496.1 Tol-Pal system protein TolB [Methanosarcinales archaeon ANME-1 ERB6]